MDIFHLPLIFSRPGIALATLAGMAFLFWYLRRGSEHKHWAWVPIFGVLIYLLTNKFAGMLDHIEAEQLGAVDNITEHLLFAERLADTLVFAVLTGTAAYLWLSQLKTIRSKSAAHQQVEQALREQEQFLGEMVATAYESVLIVNEDGNIETFSPSAERVFGYPAKEIIGHPIEKLIPERFRAQHQQNFERFLALPKTAGNKNDREVIGLRRDGTERTLNFSLFKIRGETGMKVAAIIRDLTESMHAQQMLVDSNRRLELLLNVSSVANMAATLGEAIQSCLDMVCEMTDWPIGHVYFADAAQPDRFVPGNIWHIDKPERFARFRQETQNKTFDRGSGLPGKVFEKNRPIWLEAIPLEPGCKRNTEAHAAGIVSGVAFPIRSNGKIAAVLEFYSHHTIKHEPELIDVMAAICTQLAHVMERGQIAAETQRLNETLTGLLDSTPIGVSVQRDDGSYVFVNEQQVRNLGATTKKDLLANASRAGGISPTELMERSPDGRIVSKTVQNRILHQTRPDGSAWWARINIRPFRFLGEDVFIVWMEDITEQKATEDARRANERDLRAVIDSSRSSIYLCDCDGRILLVNSEMEGRLGHSAKNIIGKFASDLVDEQMADFYAKFNAEVILAGRVLEKVYDQKYPDGAIRIILSTKSPIKDDAGNVIGISTINTDITEIKQTEQALRKSEALFKALLDNTDTPITLKDTLGRYMLVNKRFAENRGLPAEDIVGKSVFEILSSERSRAVLEQDRKVALTGTAVQEEFDLINIAGKVRRHITSRFPVVGDDGRVIAIGQISTDITDRIQAEEALRTSEARFKTLLDHMDTPVTMKDPTGRYLVANKSFLKSVNHPLQSIEGRTVAEVFDRDVTEDVQKRDTQVIQTGEIMREEFELTNTEGQLRQYIASRFPIFNEDGKAIAVGRIGTDITEYVRARNELEETEKQLRIALDNMPGGLFTFDADLNFQIVTSQYADSYQIPEDLIKPGNSIAQIIRYRAERGDYGAGDMEKLIEDRITTLRDPNMTHFFTNVPGKVLEVMRRPLQDGGILVVFNDVTQRIEAEKALALSEAKYRDLFDRAPVMMHTANSGAKILDVNRTWLKATGYSRDEVVGKIVHDFMTEESSDSLKTTALPEFLEKGYVENLPVQMRKKNGAIADMLITATSERDKNGNVSTLNSVLIDVTERNRTERELKQAHEAAEAANKAKSNFLASMSHEIRTPMNGVLGTLDLLRQTELQHDQTNLMDMAFNSANSLLDIIDDILDFSKIEAGKLTIENIDISINDVVEGVAETLLPVAANKNIDLHVFVDPSIPETVAADPIRLRQILLNLAGNAVKFTESEDDTRGNVEIRVERLPFDETNTVVLRFEVIDTGIGISEDKLQELFMPFTQAEASTTRRFGGTGLGLAISKELTELIGGQLSATSEIGKGSTFCVDFLFERGSSTENANPAADLRGVRILAAVADKKIKSVISPYLSAAGADVDFVDTIDKAKTKVQIAANDTRPYAVFLVDSGRRRLPVDIVALAGDPLFANMGAIVLTGDQPTGAYGDIPNAVRLQAPPIRRNSLLRAVATKAGLIEDRIPTDAISEKCKPAAPPSREEAIRQNQLILIVEDNPTNQEVIRRQIGFLGYLGDVVDNGVEAMKALDAHQYSVIITDCHMPKMDGFELTGAIRERERGTGKRIPIIAITGNALQGEANRCIAAGMDDYLAKPVKLIRLGETLEKWMSQVSSNAKKNAAAIRRPTAQANTDAVAPRPDRATSSPNAGTGSADSTGPRPETRPENCHGASRKPVASSIPPPDEPIDFELLATVLGSDDRSYMWEILSIFWECVAETPGELAGLASARDARSLRDAAHSAKGASSSAGANHLSKLLDKLQTAATEEDWNEIEQVMPAVDAAFVDLEQFIQGQTEPGI